MNTKSILERVICMLVVGMLAMGITSCEKDDGGKKASESDENAELYESIINEYINTTVVPTYKALAEAALDMRTVNAALKENKTDATMEAAANAWMKARIQWELSEAFLFGPVGEQAFNIDGHIDTWPLEINDITAVLEKIEKEDLKLSGEEVWGWDEEVIGFHVTEYLLFRDGKARLANEVTDAELEYLTAATDALVWDCIMAYIAWVGESNVSSTMRTVFNENEEVVTYYNERPNYQNFASKMKTESEGGNYKSWKDALCEIAVGASEIADEVAAQKIAEPYETGSTKDVESWYSWHSLDDYENNILSIKNAYWGGTSNTTRTTLSLSNYMATVDKDFDQEIKDKIEECITNIKAIGGNGQRSFYEVVMESSKGNMEHKELVDAAVESCKDLSGLFDKIEELVD